jgi:hypothetical protein
LTIDAPNPQEQAAFASLEALNSLDSVLCGDSQRQIMSVLVATKRSTITAASAPFTADSTNF